MNPGQYQLFTGSIYLGSPYPPANAITAASVSWYLWSLDPESAGVYSEGGTSTTSGGMATDKLNFTALSNGSQQAALTAQAVVSGIANNLTATDTITVSAGKTQQTISFPPIPAQSAAANLSLSATASSTLPVAYNSETPSVCVVNGAVATLGIAGKCTIDAEQIGNGTYAAASATQSFTVTLAGQTITFPAIAAQSPSTSFALAATSTSGLAVTYTSTTPSVCTVSGTVASLNSVGTCTITAQQAGNATYSAASATQSFLVAAGQAAAPIFSQNTGTYTAAPTVTITSSSPGTSIFYTVDGTTPTPSSPQYTGPVTVKGSETLQAIAAGGFYTTSGVTSATYTLEALAPVISPAAGTYPGPLTVTITTASPGVDIFYTTAGNWATTSSPRYTGPITLSASEKINAITAQTGWTTSADVAHTYTIEPYAATPTFSVAAGTYATAQTVAISDATAGATIYYTTDGSAPTTNGSVYSGPIAVSATETLNAIAVANNYSNSAVATASYTIQ